VLSAREVALGQYREVQAMGARHIRGADMELVTAARLGRARRAEHVIRAAFASERYSLREPDDGTLTTMLEQVQVITRQLEQQDQGLVEVRGGRSDDGSV
jgi:hypothetical protein